MIINGIFDKKILLVVAGLGVLVSYPFAHQLFLGQKQPKLALFDSIETEDSVTSYVQEINAQGSNLAQELKEQLDIEFDIILERLKQAFPLTPQAWNEALAEFNRLKTSDKLFLDRPKAAKQGAKEDVPALQKSRELLASYNINPEVINFEVINDPNNASYAFAGQCVFNGKVEHYLRLNLAQLPNQTPAIQEALLRHEIMHLCNYDPLICDIIEKLLAEHGISAKEFWSNDAFRALNKHMEYRADLMASIHDIATARALMEGFQEHMKRYDDAVESKTHPSCKQRYAAVDNLVQYMKAEKNLITS